MNSSILNRFLLTCFFMLFTNCKKEEQIINNIQIKKENNCFNIYSHNKCRLSGLETILENADFRPTSSSTNSNDIIYSNSQANVIVETKIINGVIIFSLSTHNLKFPSSSDFAGLVFDSIPNYKIGTAFYKYGPVKAWTNPVKVNNMGDVKESDNQFFIWQYADGLYAAMMPLAGKGFVSQIGKYENKLAIKSYSNLETQPIENIPIMAIAFGSNPYQTVENLYAVGLKFTDKENSLRKNKTYPILFEKLMWCTWNSLGHGVDEKNIVASMEEFKKQGIKFPLVLIDDGWSTVSKYVTGKLQSFEPNKTKFPNGLKPLITKLKNEYGVENLGVWHAYNGYWAGIDSSSELGIKYKPNLLAYQDKVAWANEPESTFYITNPKTKAGFEFYDEWYTYLKSEGVSFVKVDNQLIADRVAKNNYPFETLAKAMQTNMQSAVNKHFEGNVLNCMDMTTDAVYHFGSSAIGRSSEDFFPENTSYNMQAGNSAIHVLNNVYNSLWWSQMAWPDFDMFQSQHPNAEFNAIARAISGGPIYVSDVVGKSNAEILKKLTLKDGTIVRADQPALPTEDCLFTIQDTVPLKVFTKSNETGLLAIFNVADCDTAKGYFKPSDINGLKGRNFAVYDYFQKKLRKLSLNDETNVELPKMGYQLHYIKLIKNKFASFGLIEKYNAPKTIKKEIVQDKLVLLELFESGTFAAYCEKTPIKVVSEYEFPLEYSLIDGLLLIKLPEGKTKIGIQF